MNEDSAMVNNIIELQAERDSLKVRLADTAENLLAAGIQIDAIVKERDALKEANKKLREEVCIVSESRDLIRSAHGDCLRYIAQLEKDNEHCKSKLDYVYAQLDALKLLAPGPQSEFIISLCKERISQDNPNE